MLKIYSEAKTERFLRKYSGWIREVAGKYGVPAAAIQAVIRREMPEIDLMDAAADLVVLIGCFRKKDSSTGPMQIFGRVGLEAVNFAVDRGLAAYDDLGIETAGRLDPSSRKDVRRIWKMLFFSPKANIEIAALNLISAADEMTGRTGFRELSEEEMKLVFTRYNANTGKITPYGEQTYRYYLKYGGDTEESGSVQIENI